MSNEGVSSMGPRSSDGKAKGRGRKQTTGESNSGATAGSETDDTLPVSADNEAYVPVDQGDPGALGSDATTEDEPVQAEQAGADEPVELDEPNATVYRNRFANLASPEAGWAVPGVTGLDAGSNAGDEADDGTDDDYGRFGVSRAAADPDRFLGYDAVALLEEFDQLNERLATVVGCADAHAARRLVERLTPTVRRLEALVGQAAGKAATGGGTDSCRHSTPRVWLAYETRVTPTVAGSMLADQDFLGRQPEIATARAAGELSWQHITAFRTVVTAKPWREAPFAQVVDHFVTVALCSDPTELRRALNSWAEATDDEVAPDRPDRAYSDRALHLRQVGEIWDIRGTLPKLEGATLAGVLDEVITAARRAGCTCGQDPCSCPDDATPRATKRADALTALAGWATAHRTCLADDTLLSAGGAQRSRPMIIVPLDRLAPKQIPASLREHLNALVQDSRNGTNSTGRYRAGGGTNASSGGGAGLRPNGGRHVNHDGSTTGCGCGSTSADSNNPHPHADESHTGSAHTRSSRTDGTHTGGPDAGERDPGSPPAAGRDPHGSTSTVPPGADRETVRLTARELNEGLTALGVSAVRWYAGSESGTLNRRDTEVELCDATVARIITDPNGYPLDVGHETRLINPGLRAALITRDGGCVVSGCTIPAAWCDAHQCAARRCLSERGWKTRRGCAVVAVR